MKSVNILIMVLAVVLLIAGCSQKDPMEPTGDPSTRLGNKDGTETLGPPSIDIASGSGFTQGGVGMVGLDTGILDVEVPAGSIAQVLLYWAGGTTGADGDNMIKIDGTDVTGTLIGGDTVFFQAGGYYYHFWSYRADITDLGLVNTGANSFEITEFDFDVGDGPLDENNGIGMMVIYDDGTTADVQVRDGLDLAFFQFDDPLDATVPQNFFFAPEPMDRYAKMVIFAGSVGEGRPNAIKLTTSEGEDIRTDELGSTDGSLWDSLCLEDILIPAGASYLTVELISTVSEDPLGASLAWVGAGLSVPVTPDPELFCLGDFVWYDENRNGCQDEGELGVEGVEVYLLSGCLTREAVMFEMSNKSGHMVYTDEMGYYEFCDLLPGEYTVQFVAPEGYEFCEQYADGCDPEHDSNVDEGGLTDCITLVDADDWTIDAGLCMPPPPAGCLIIIDEDGIDNDMFTIEQAAWGHDVEPDYLINDDRPTEVGNPPLRWNTLFPGDIVLLPTGEVDDEGWFALPEDTPWSVADFAAGTVPQDQLDKINDVMPIRNQDLVSMIGRTCTAVVYDSDISMNYDPINANLQGARYGLFTFTLLAVEVPGDLPEAQSSTSLFSVWVRVEEPQMPTNSFQITVRDHEPDAIEINLARYHSGQLKVYGESDFAPDAYMTVTVDGPDMGSDLGTPPYVLEQPMIFNGGQNRYEFIEMTGVNLNGRRVTISTAEGGSYTEYIE